MQIRDYIYVKSLFRNLKGHGIVKVEMRMITVVFHGVREGVRVESSSATSWSILGMKTLLKASRS